MGSDGLGLDWIGLDWMGWDGMGWDGMAWHGMAWHEKGWDGMGASRPVRALAPQRIRPFFRESAPYRYPLQDQSASEPQEEGWERHSQQAGFA